jgi:hypothetical protein
MAEGQAVAARELRRLLGLPLNWLIIWHSVTSISPMSIAKPSSSGTSLDADLAHADLAGEGMVLA